MGNGMGRYIYWILVILNCLGMFDAASVKAEEPEAYGLHFEDWNQDGYMDIVEKRVWETDRISGKVPVHLWNEEKQCYEIQTFVKRDTELREKLESPKWDLGDITMQEFTRKGHSPVVWHREWSCPAWEHPVLKFVFCGMEDFDEYGEWYYRLEIYSDETDESPAGIQYFEFMNPIREEDIALIDMNFDGCQDLVVRENYFSANASFRMLVWDQKESAFADIPFLAAAFGMDDEKQEIYIRLHDSASSGEIEVWKWFGDEFWRTAVQGYDIADD